MIDLSVLICSTHTRWKTFGPKIQEQVWEQYARMPFKYQRRLEILMLTDNKQMMLGQKRNVMVDMAQGKYVQFIDDDDRIAPDMFRTILDATTTDADVITFLVEVSINGEAPKICRYSKDFKADKNTDDGYERLPNHICCVKREVALKSSFPNLPYGEDSAYSKILLPHLQTEHSIDKVLYHYDYHTDTTEAQQRKRASLRMRSAAQPVVDVIFLSNAKNVALKKMTQKAIDTCLRGANSLPVNIIVLEQQKRALYRHATTVHAPEEFNYNAFANRGAEMGTAEWIMIANNDLIFHDGWLHELLAVQHPVVSPKCPVDKRQAMITENTVGDQIGTHFSGWCFMISRELWKQIGGFDECVTFWFSDDCVVEQVKQVGVTPMIVPGARVRHLGSVTLKKSPDMNAHTYGQVDIFNQKYGKNKFEDSPGYRAWKARNG